MERGRLTPPSSCQAWADAKLMGGTRISGFDPTLMHFEQASLSLWTRFPNLDKPSLDLLMVLGWASMSKPGLGGPLGSSHQSVASRSF
jgi:hypothetical protein